MFEDVEVAQLLSTIDGHDFSADPDLDFGAARIDAIVAYERIIRAAQARQLAQINALYQERIEQIPFGSGDAALSVIGEVGMARNVSPGAGRDALLRRGLSARNERVPAITISADTLLGADDTPAELDGYGPITPGLVDDLLSHAHRTFYRRLITDPADHTLIGRDPRRRRFDGPLNGFVRARDRNRCRQPGCDCRISDIDHITDYAHGGPTTSANGQGLCGRSHTFKHLPGWKVTTGGRDTIWRTPTGHTYTSPTPTVLTPRRM